jgi:hypothetical protein
MKLTGWKMMMGVIVGVLVGDGCQKPPPPPPPPPPPAWEVPADRPAQVSELSQRIERLNQAISELPGTSQDEHQQSAAEILDNLSKILRLAQGSDVTPKFMNRINVVDEAHAVQVQPDMSAARAEASENEAVRAALDILQPIAVRDEPKDDRLAGLFNSALTKLDAMYATTGPMHDLAAKEGFQALSRVLSRLSDDLVGQFGAAQQVTS